MWFIHDKETIGAALPVIHLMDKNDARGGEKQHQQQPTLIKRSILVYLNYIGILYFLCAVGKIKCIESDKEERITSSFL